MHFIITRFNLRIWQQDKNNIPTHTSEWLEHRFELFEKYCLPSVENQTNKNFIWLCMFDKETPAPYKERIRNI